MDRPPPLSMATGRSSAAAQRPRHGARRSCAGAPRPGGPQPRAVPPGYTRRAALRLRRSSWASRHHSSRCQEGSHFLQADPHAALYRSERHLHPAGDLHVGVATKVGELECLPLGIGEVAKTPLDLLALQVERNRLPDVGHLGSLPGIRQIDLAANSYAPAQTIDRAVANDRQQPVAQAAATRVEARGVAPDADKRVLDDILRGTALIEDAEGETEGQAAVPVVQRFDRRGFATFQLGRHLTVLVSRLPTHPRTHLYTVAPPPWITAFIP